MAAGWLLVAVLPATRPVLGDRRVTILDGRAVACQAAVRIPVGTVPWEEIAFRGVLQAALRRILAERAAIAVTSAVFGLRHIRPTAGALRANGLAGDRRRAAAGVLAGVTATAAAGALLSWLRERSAAWPGPCCCTWLRTAAAWSPRGRSPALAAGYPEGSLQKCPGSARVGSASTDGGAPPDSRGAVNLGGSYGDLAARPVSHAG